VSDKVVTLITIGRRVMKALEVHELVEHINEILCMVKEEGETIEVTNHGEVIAHLVPVHRPRSSAELVKRDVWAKLDRLAAEIGAHWSEDISAVDAVRDVRRDL
jgi:antitoxin (DNA-binding transcriptional repressor) of toxin-antitoxin stability system